MFLLFIFIMLFFFFFFNDTATTEIYTLSLHDALPILLAGHDCVLLVNGDSPTLPSHFLIQAIEALRHSGDRMVLGPASDGGYYLIGLKRPHKELFAQIEWGTETVFGRTRERAAE